ncbi:hypothetical protein BCE02nite_18320 [Brevibacillus centrosporus]|uniref:peptidoglycan-binding domain-containing protein n=1 Tax=Brevibacillus centrosporus TaxID=54910 RepID=UPI000F0A33CD|nr:hypothetical protein EDM55_02745 [Brevibacillus centrosporus]GED30691.1 hypothetical protein BCE02nite_18320 [Brevibacillus centrosporus]
MIKGKSIFASKEQKTGLRKGFIRKVSAGLLVLTLTLSLPSGSLAVGKGAHGPDIFVLQGMLKSLGSYAGTINGYYDDVTQGL